MSVLRQTAKVCPIDLDDISHEFVESVSVYEEVPVFDSKGVKVRTIKKRKVNRTPIPKDVWENKGIKAELFCLENQLANGVNVKPFEGNFIGLDLDVSSQLGEQFIEGVNAFVENEKKNNQSIKSEE